MRPTPREMASALGTIVNLHKVLFVDDRQTPIDMNKVCPDELIGQGFRRQLKDLGRHRRHFWRQRMTPKMEHPLIWPPRALPDQVMKVGKFCADEEEATAAGYFWMLDIIPVQEIGHVTCRIFTAAVSLIGGIAC